MTGGSDQNRISWVLEGSLLQAQASNDWLEHRILPLSVDQLRWKPRSGCWSIAACLDHLNRTLSYYLPRIQDALDGNLPMKSGERGLRSTDSEEMFLRQMEPPVAAPMNAPSVIVPGSAVDPDEVVDQFPHLRTRFAATIRSITDVDSSVSIPGSIHPPVDSLGGVIALLAAHERRHLWQVQRILSAPGFPDYRVAKLVPGDGNGS